MTDEKIRIAIAEASHGTIEYFEGVWLYWSNGNRFACKDNDPLEDLNAMHEAEKVLTDEEQEKMNDLLWDLMAGKKFLWRASARQRAEALLKTLNLWESPVNDQ